MEIEDLKLPGIKHPKLCLENGTLVLFKKNYKDPSSVWCTLTAGDKWCFPYPPEALSLVTPGVSHRKDSIGTSGGKTNAA